MSKKNNPNFNAAGFAAQVTAHFYKSIRGGATKDNIEFPEEMFLDFFMQVNDYVDISVEKMNREMKLPMWELNGIAKNTDVEEIEGKA